MADPALEGTQYPVAEDHREAFERFVRSGEASTDFRRYLDQSAEAQRAVELAYIRHSEAVEMLAQDLQPAHTVVVNRSQAKRAPSRHATGFFGWWASGRRREGLLAVGLGLVVAGSLYLFRSESDQFRKINVTQSSAHVQLEAAADQRRAAEQERESVKAALARLKANETASEGRQMTLTELKKQVESLQKNLRDVKAASAAAPWHGATDAPRPVRASNAAEGTAAGETGYQENRREPAEESGDGLVHESNFVTTSATSRIEGPRLTGSLDVHFPRPLPRYSGGKVVVDVRVGTDGRVTDAKIVHSVPGTDDAVLKAVRRAMFIPGKINGIPQAMSTELPFDIWPVSFSDAGARLHGSAPLTRTNNVSPTPSAAAAAPAASPTAGAPPAPVPPR